MFANKQVNVITEQTATVPVTAGPLAEVTKSRTCLENSLNNSGTTSNTLHSQKKNEQLPPVAPKQQAGVAAKQGGGAKGKHQIIKPWSSMNSADLALIAMQLNQDGDDEGEVAPHPPPCPSCEGCLHHCELHPPCGDGGSVRAHDPSACHPSGLDLPCPRTPHQWQLPRQLLPPLPNASPASPMAPSPASLRSPSS